MKKTHFFIVYAVALVFVQSTRCVAQQAPDPKDAVNNATTQTGSTAKRPSGQASKENPLAAKPALSDLISKGDQLVRKNQLDDAAKVFRQAISLYPNSID